MKVVDVNLLLHAVDEESPNHRKARSWLEETLSGEEPVAFPWVVLLGFVRLATSPRVFPAPLEPEKALEVVDGWLSRSCVRVLEPGEDHWRLLTQLLVESGTAGNLTTDAHLAAIVIEHGAELASADADFARFPRLRWTNPLRG